MPCPNCSCASCLAITGSLASLAELLPPPFELTITNRAPTDSEVACSRTTIDSARKRVLVLQAMLDDLEKQKAKLLALATKHKVAISPLKRFPPELLTALFTECVDMVPTEDYLTHSRSGSLNCPPLMLMGVCSQWRKIILDTPRLWTRILTAPPQIDSWVIRSKELPLYVQLNFSWDHTPAYSALDALVPHAHRWEQVNFRLGPNSNSALNPVKARLQSLKRLKLSFDRVTGAVDFCEIAPQLTEIWLEMICEPIAIKLPWGQLRLCTLDNTGIALYVLQQAKNIRTCHLKQRDSYPHWLSIPRGPHSHHLELDTLIIDEWCQSEGCNMSSFFSSLTLPSLRVLDVHFPRLMYFSSDEDSDNDSEYDNGAISGPQPGSIFLEFIERSSTHLNKLRLIYIPIPPSQFIDCLALTQSLVSLDIQYDEYWDAQNHGIDDEFLHALSANIPGPVLPRLNSLFLRGRCCFSETALDAFVASRRDINSVDVQTVALLKHLTLDCSTPMDWPSEPPSFHRFASEGLNIEYGPHWGLF